MTTPDATKPGVSADPKTVEGQQALDNSGQPPQNEPNDGAHPVKQRQHPSSQREDVMSRFEQFREANAPAAAKPGSLGEELLEDEADEAVATQAAAAEAEAAKAAAAAKTTPDPLAEHIVRDAEGNVFVKTKVDGTEKLVPFDRALAQLQKHEAADLRLQTASEKLRAAEERERLAAAQPAKPAPPPVKGADPESDAALEREAAELVTSLIEEDEAEAAKKLAAALKKARSTGSQVDKEALAAELAPVLEARRAETEQKKALLEGWNAYKKEYGESVVEKDPALRAWAYAKGDEIAAANPTWTPKQWMLEAGRQAEALAGVKREAPPSAKEDPPPANNRQERKQALQPVPQSRSAIRGNDKPEQPDNSPTGILNEYRRARGQPVLASQRGG